MDALKFIVSVLQILSAIALIGVIMSQATKSEGLTGTIGGKTESAFRGKPGADDRLKQVTKWVAIAFLVSSVLVAIVYH